MGIVKSQPTFCTDRCLCGDEFFGADGRQKFLIHSVDCKVQKVFRGEMTANFTDSSRQFEKLYNSANDALKDKDRIIAELGKQIEASHKK